MSYIKEIALKNYRSFVDARCRLSPFTLIVGANNAGKSNLLKAVADFSRRNQVDYDSLFEDPWLELRHHATALGKAEVEVYLSDGSEKSLDGEVTLFQFNPSAIGKPESKRVWQGIASDGGGVSLLLDKWNSGSKDHRERFANVMREFVRCVPEIEALSFYDDQDGRRGVQVEQFGLPKPAPLSEVSDGTRLVLAILTLVNLENPPPVMLLEDINHGLHPRLYERIVEFLRTIANEGKTQILATTHDPYLIDEFRDNPEAVVIVEKKEGASTLTNLDEKLKELNGDDEPLDMPLGELWFSGSLGGVPRTKLPEILKPQLK